MRPSLTKSISLEDFQNYYWLKAELQTFCRKNGLPASGSKIEITERISHYLHTGKILKTALVQKRVKLLSLIKTFLFKLLSLKITAVAKRFGPFSKKNWSKLPLYSSSSKIFQREYWKNI